MPRKYAQERKQFGKPIAEFQGMQFQIAEMATEIEAARLMVYNAARMKDAGMNFVKEAAMTKLFCLAGGGARHVARRWRSMAATASPRTIRSRSTTATAKIGKIYEGTSNMQLQTIAKLVLGK